MKKAMRRSRYVFVALVGVLVAVQVLFLRPSTLEVSESATKKGLFKDLSTMMKTQRENDEVRYTIQGFHYTAVTGEVKQWEIESDTALLYETSKKVLANNARIRMYDSTGNITFIEGLEAHYTMGEKNFDLYKDVKVTFPDGFWVKTEEAHYSGATQIVSSPIEFHGQSQKTKTDFLQVWGTGFTASRVDPEVHILANSHVKIHRLVNGEIDDVRSDKSRIDRFKKLAYFSMNDSKNFVNSILGTLQVKSRRQEANYDSASHSLAYMTAFEDVFIKETDTKKEKEGLKYATCQRADFVSKDDKILLTGFPSAYQENDTVTGELITVYRTRNIIEVDQANGFHAGTNTTPVGSGSNGTTTTGTNAVPAELPGTAKQ